MKRIGQRFEIEGSVRRKSGSGRPRASTVKDDHRLKMTVLKDRKKTYVDHSKEFKTAAGNSLSRMTISRRLNEVGFNSKKCAKKPLFPAIKVLKLAWPIFFVHECRLTILYPHFPHIVFPCPTKCPHNHTMPTWGPYVMVAWEPWYNGAFFWARNTGNKNVNIYKVGLSAS